jgi:alkylation response protein AidB-like acyl-CoA dehydrogenase
VDSNEVAIENLEVPDDHVVGTVGDGFYHLIESLNPERIVVAIEAVGIGRAALERAVQYAKERVVFDRPIGKNQGIAHPLAHAQAELDCAELLCMKAAWLFDSGRPCGREANAVALIAAEASFNACDAALQTFGGFGYAKEFTSSARGARCGSTRSRRCRSRWRSTTRRARAGAAQVVLRRGI